MKDRIKALRKAEGLTQDEFGARIGIKKSSLSMLESGKNNPSDQTILAICREFHVREEWLRTGEEPMREALSRREEIEKFFDEVSTLPDSDFRSIIISYLAAADADGWAMLENEIRRIAALFPASPPAQTDQLTIFNEESDIDRQVAEYRRQLELEASQAAKSSASLSGSGTAAAGD